MADFKISGKNVITQAGTAEPVLASNVTLGTGIVKSANIIDAATTTLSCTTDSTITVATADTSSLSLGMAVSGTNIPANAHIVTIPNATSFTITSAATGAATSTLTFLTGVTNAKLNLDYSDATYRAPTIDSSFAAATKTIKQISSSRYYSVNDVLVFLNGVCLIPTTDYTISTTTLTLVEGAPATASSLVVRYLAL